MLAGNLLPPSTSNVKVLVPNHFHLPIDKSDSGSTFTGTVDCSKLLIVEIGTIGWEKVIEIFAAVATEPFGEYLSITKSSTFEFSFSVGKVGGSKSLFEGNSWIVSLYWVGAGTV